MDRQRVGDSQDVRVSMGLYHLDQCIGLSGWASGHHHAPLVLGVSRQLVQTHRACTDHRYLSVFTDLPAGFLSELDERTHEVVDTVLFDELGHRSGHRSDLGLIVLYDQLDQTAVDTTVLVDVLHHVLRAVLDGDARSSAGTCKTGYQADLDRFPSSCAIVGAIVGCGSVLAASGGHHGHHQQDDEEPREHVPELHSSSLSCLMVRLLVRA